MNKSEEIDMVGSVVSILLTGAFILNDLGISPILDSSFEVVIGQSPPEYYGIAIGAVGAYVVVYQLIFVFLISPFECRTDIDEIPLDDDVSVDNIQKTDFLNIFMIFLVYEYLLIRNGLLTNEAVFAGFAIIISSMFLQITPRYVVDYIEYESCFRKIKLTAISVPITVLVFVPSMILVELI